MAMPGPMTPSHYPGRRAVPGTGRLPVPPGRRWPAGCQWLASGTVPGPGPALRRTVTGSWSAHDPVTHRDRIVVVLLIQAEFSHRDRIVVVLLIQAEFSLIPAAFCTAGCTDLVDSKKRCLDMGPSEID